MLATPALENPHVKHPVHAKRGKDAQRRGRGVALGWFRPDQKHRALARLGVRLQPAQLLGAHLR